MTATNHVLTGMVIGSTVANPFFALPIAFLSHFAIDALPHYGLKRQDDAKFLYYLSLDMGAAAGLLLVVFMLQPEQWPIIVLSGIACSSPDLMWLPDWLRLIMGKKKKNPGLIKRFHAKVQWAEKNAWWGIAFEVFWFISMFGVISQTLR